MLRGTPDALLVVSCDGGSEVVVLPLASRDPCLHHEAEGLVIGLTDRSALLDSLDLFQCPSLCLRNEVVDKSNREETSKCVDKPNHRS